ncbi:ABR174Wp [Eremothecium gossypii ATCC 10895]|uniref:ABR174Wp n=1 Tax=Eremothecium gossypii (strain ATCC 10895 / CBS 109.51 / FGSC 9923 / NRRL Y-1056) TaxID=284811 RepID=Q75D49_EREGS|nr:ABR174Wp [Eremothecium gossypii ATCC 10895]AAS50946.2 ABR174Wp [Eremothecium gossypii ATCC 10895]AEY95236.1 FABR174Wp [Eremothecium gossypii FDAG1]
MSEGMKSSSVSQDEDAGANGTEDEELSRACSPYMRRQNRKKFACVECRQQKSKCNAHDRAPEPCSRCAKKNVPCVLQRDFRRTYKRVRNEVIERRFRELTSSLSNLGAEEILQRLEEEQRVISNNGNFTKEKIKRLRELGDLGLEAARAPEPPAAQTELEESGPLTAEQLKCAAKSLGDVHLAPEEIAHVFQEYAERYHRFLPVVEISKGPEKIYALSPCLFWVIVLIGLRREFGTIETMRKLSKLVKVVLAEISVSPIIRNSQLETSEPALNVASVYSVQALLLYTYWPPLTSSLSADTSWNTIGLTMFQAIQLGLNTVQYSEGFTHANAELVREHTKTWLYCNVVSQTIASAFGFPAFVCFDHTVMSTFNHSISTARTARMPSRLKQMAQVAHFENQLASTMHSNPLSPSGLLNKNEMLPLLRILDRQLDVLEMELNDSNADEFRRFSFLVSKVHLYSYYFILAGEGSTSQIDGHSATLREAEIDSVTKHGLLKAYNAAVALLQHTNSMWERNPSMVKYFPGVFVLSIWQSACIVAKLAQSSLCEVLDIALGEKVYQNAVSLCFNASVLKHDMAYRSSGIMKSMWLMFSDMHDNWNHQGQPSDPLSPSSFNLAINVKSRMAVSVFFDCLYILRRKCGMAKLRRQARRRPDDTDIATTQSAGNDRSVSMAIDSSQNPVESARRIIQTIPLDPEPINASTATDASSCDSGSDEALLLRKILHHTSSIADGHSLRTAASGGTPIPAESTRPFSDSRGASVQPSTHATTLHHSVFDRPGGAYRSVSSVDTTVSGILLDTSARLPEHSTDRSVPEPYNAISDLQSSDLQPSDPATRSWGSWDEWESDLIFKDVGILMNEFAFNPEVL